MNLSRKKAVCLLLCCGWLPVATALACGTYFGPRLTADRETALLNLWEGGFDAEAPYLLAPPQGLPNLSAPGFRYFPTRYDLEVSLLGEEVAESLRMELHGLAHLHEHEQRGGPWPPAALAYQKGLHQWLRFDDEKAIELFTQAAAMAGDNESPWPLMAEFMIGRAYQRKVNRQIRFLDDLVFGEADAFDVRVEEVQADIQRFVASTVAAYERTRQRVQDGEPDPLGLSVASLGNEAQLWLDEGRYDLGLRLYAQQAALGSDRALKSLQMVLPWALEQRGLTEQVLADPDSRAVLALYMYSHFRSHLLDRERTPSRRSRVPGMDEPGFGWADALRLLIETIESEPPGDDGNAARLAALMYRQGRYDLAERFAATNTAPLAAWVRAKLALRSGDLETAAEAYGKAIHAYPEHIEYGRSDGIEMGEGKVACRVRAEAGVLALSRGDFIDSLLLFLEAGGVYWNDAAYVAERILTVDELIALVDDLRAGELAIRLPERPPRVPVYHPSGGLWYVWDTGRHWLVDDVAAGLGDLLARRLMRAGRHDEAIAYFQHDVVRDHAIRYRDALEAAEHTDGIDKAAQLYRAATIARSYGLRILSFDSWPDWAVLGANHARPRWPPLPASNGADETTLLPWHSGVEFDRLLAHSGAEEPRFSYRLVAAELADRAADHLDPKSQTFAAVLCNGTRWLLSREPQLARRYYQRYLDEGAPMPWGENFGRSCPVPQGLQVETTS